MDVEAGLQVGCIYLCGDSWHSMSKLRKNAAMLLQETQLPLWLRPYEVLVTSNRTALIELIPDSLSIHTIKAKSPPGTSLRDHFIARHGQVHTHKCLLYVVIDLNLSRELGSFVGQRNNC